MQEIAGRHLKNRLALMRRVWSPFSCDAALRTETYEIFQSFRRVRLTPVTRSTYHAVGVAPEAAADLDSEITAVSAIH